MNVLWDEWLEMRQGLSDEAHRRFPLVDVRLCSDGVDLKTGILSGSVEPSTRGGVARPMPLEFRIGSSVCVMG